jgi:hypothetical protein
MISYIKYTLYIYIYIYILFIYYIYRCVSAGKASYKLKYYNIEELKAAVGFTTEYYTHTHTHTHTYTQHIYTIYICIEHIYI